MHTVLIGASVLVILLLALGLLLRSLAVASGPVAARRGDDLDLERYRVLERLLDPAEFAYLAAQPGYTPELGRHLRRERRRVFRCYLVGLRGDYTWLESRAWSAVAGSAEDESGTVTAIMRQRALFERRLLAVHCGLTLDAIGIHHVNVRPLLESLDFATRQARLQPC